MTLYEMTEQAKQLYALLESGEIDEQAFNDTVEAMDTEEKLKNYIYVIKQFEADAEILKAEKEKIEAKQRIAENGAKRLRAKIVEFMKASGTTKTKADIFTLNVTATEKVNITDESKIPAIFLKEAKPTIDKTAIKKAIKENEVVPGAELTVTEAVRIK